MTHFDPNRFDCYRTMKWFSLNRSFNVVFRPFSEDDVRAKTPMVVTCNEDKQEVIVTQNLGNKQIDKTFSFDKVRF